MTIDPIVVDYDKMFAATGTIPLPERPPLRKAYRLVELRRWSTWRGVPLVPEPRWHYRGEVEEPDERIAALMVTAAMAAGEDSLTLARSRHQPGALGGRAIPLRSHGIAFDRDGERVRRFAVRPSSPRRMNRRRFACTRAQILNQTEQAIARGVFGMPFYIFRGEPFWGQDRLEMLEAALAS